MPSQVLGFARTHSKVKRSIAKLSLGTVSKAMQRFSGEKLLCSYGVVLVAACIKGTESNWRAVFASGILQQVSAAVDRHSSDSQVSTLGPQLLALSKSQVRCAKGCVCVCVCECVCVCDVNTHTHAHARTHTRAPLASD